jgi:quinoprotein glucose dehydrogenase
VNIDGGAAVDPETGYMYVGGQSGMSTIQVQKDPCSEFRYSSPHDSCGKIGALPAPPGYQPSGAGRGGFEGRNSGTTIGGVSIFKPKKLGGVTAYNMNTGDKAWWIPNGGKTVPVTSNDPLFAGVKLPESTGGRGQPQVITTKSLVIYGTGRSGGAAANAPAQLYAHDKATGQQVGAINIPSRTTAVPMTFMHQGRQYIVFAIGQGANTSLVALALPPRNATKASK